MTIHQAVSIKKIIKKITISEYLIRHIGGSNNRGEENNALLAVPTFTDEELKGQLSTFPSLRVPQMSYMARYPSECLCLTTRNSFNDSIKIAKASIFTKKLIDQ